MKYIDRRRERQLFVWRQYGALRDQGLPDSDNLNKLRASLGAQYADEVRFLGQLVMPEQSDLATTGAGDAAARLDANGVCRSARALGCDLPRTIVGLEQLTRRAEAFSRMWWRGVTSLMLYAITLLVLASMLVTFFTVSVLPGFAHFFWHSGITEGGIAGRILDHRTWLLDTPLCLGFILVLLVFMLFYHLRNHTGQLKALTPAWKWVPLLSGTWRAFNQAMALNHAQIFIATGAKARDAMAVAFSLFGLKWDTQPRVSTRKDNDSALDWLHKSDDLGTLETEIAVQAEKQWSVLEDTVFSMRDSVTLLLRIILYLLIGMIVVVLYQPIFYLGRGI
ncbi:MAG: hypothetical protein G3I10_11195 [Ferrovum sp.]|nr:hypothetical protein [Ferrovum sp.]